jgi:hypothetical protein
MLDWTVEPDLLEFLAERTDQPVHVLASMRLNSGDIRDLLFQNRSGPRVCPACLSEGVPYFRRAWRIAFYRVCEVHCVALVEACSECGSTVRLDDLFPADRGICICRNCGIDLVS